MMKWIKKAIDTRNAEQVRRARAEGFTVAMRSYYLEGWSVDMIRAGIYGDGILTEYPAQTQGALDAIQLIESAENPHGSIVGRQLRPEPPNNPTWSSTGWVALEIAAVAAATCLAALIAWWLGG